MLILGIGITGYVLLSGNMHNKILLNALLARTSSSFIEDQNLRTLDIKLKKDDSKHFKRLFRDYHGEGLGEQNHKFLKYYQKHNEWKETKIKLNDEKYHVKIKSQGNTPFAHKFGDHFSFKLKFRGHQLTPFFGNPKLSFIIYNRLQRKPSFLRLIAEKIDLPIHHHELISVNFDQHKNYLYYAEEPINQTFFENRNLPWIIFNSKVDGSLIHNDYISFDETMAQLKKKLKHAINYSPNLRDQIYSDYNRFNSAIRDSLIDSMKIWTDLDYYARVNAMRVIIGGDGHGFDDENLEMAYDTINRKFYPIPHRDLNTFTLEDCISPYNHLDNERVKIAFWQVLNAEKAFIELTEQKLLAFTLQYSIQDIQQEIDSINQYFDDAFLLKRSSLSNAVDGSSIINNLNCLKERFKSNPNL